MNPITAAKNGDVDFIKQVELDVLRVSRDKSGRSALLIATIEGHLNCCQEILKRSPSIIYQTNTSDATALHDAAWNDDQPIIQLLITTANAIGSTRDQLGDIESGITSQDNRNLLTMVNFSKSTALHLAVTRGYLESAKLLIQADPSNKLLRMVDQNGNTALHIAVENHNLGLINLLVEADPDYEYCANVSGNTPLYIAFQEALAGDEIKVEIRKLLIEKQSRQCKVRIGRNHWTLLHHATYKGNLSAIEDIVQFCPECLYLVDNDLQNCLHLAVKFERVNVVTHLLGIPTIADEVLNGQDNHGNTPLHIAALAENARIALLFLYNTKVDKTIMNMQGLRAIDMIHFDYDKRRAGVYGLTDRVGEKEIKDQTDFDLLVGALIATVSFTAGITVPGGCTSDGPYKGTAILAKKVSIKIFSISNTIALLLSLYAVFSHFCVKRLRKKEDIIYQLTVATYCSFGAIFAMVVAFITGSYVVLAVTEEFSITICVLCCCFFIFAFRALWRMLMQDRSSLFRA
ncbi:hypothetical protein AQUCO_04500085v1 [Aquilegia coerulea]|uniref:PGG domain-containing protein n=1 Tax=Aquilegia coerulea TaxID=218851 RepID=A0A2G5CLV1_AQUCA|nr:hypothetical protein AQUCO_04500085v1 [Aquilegia coerulea]